ncbi:MAG: ABC transporter permease [Gemmatimonadota bacterium]
MSTWRHMTCGLRRLFRRDTSDREIADEVEHFLEQAIAARVAGGATPEEARRATRLEMGSPSTVREEVRGYGWDGVAGTVLSDARFALRVLRRTPVFTAIAIFVIALGSGAVTTIFSAMNAIVLRPLPGTTDARRLIAIDRRTPDEAEGVSASYELFDFVRQNTHALQGIAAWGKATFTMSGGGEGTTVYGNLVSGNYFSVLGVRPEMGRFFAADEDRTPLTHPVVVISHSLWTTQFAADSGIVGRTVRVSGVPYTVIGVAPPDFHGVFSPILVDAWVPLMMQQQLRPGRDIVHDTWLWTFGRLADGVNRDAARVELTSLVKRYVDQRTEPEWRARFTAIRLTEMDGLPADAHAMALGFIALLMGASVLVLLIASVNVASMLSARAIARRREMAVRAALGAGRGRLVRQLLTEVVVLFVLGGLGGIVLAVQATSAMERLSVPVDVPMALEISPDVRVFAFALTIALLTGLIFGLAPALRAANSDINARLRDGTTGAGTRRRIMGNSLIIGQLALSLVLLVVAGLFLRALDLGTNANPGFDPTGVMTASLNTQSYGYDTQKAHQFYQGLRDRLDAAPGVVSVSFASNMPLAFATSTGSVWPDGIGAKPPTEPGKREDGKPIQMTLIGTGFFETMKLPIRRGRAFERTDDVHAPKVVVVNETFAARFWPDGSAVGRGFTYLDDHYTIIGVARDSKYDSLTEETPAFVYFGLEQAWVPGQIVLVRDATGGSQASAAMQRAVQAIDPTLPRPVVTSLRDANSIVLLPQRIAAIVTGTLGAVGLLLATLGLYGMIVYGVNRRTREIGLRMALGATRGDVVWLIIREGMVLAGLGVLIGLVLAAAATRLLASLLLNVSPLDAVTFGGMSLLFIGVAMLASYLPARRAAGADPMLALRVD